MEAMRESWTDHRLDAFRESIEQRFEQVDRRLEDVDRRFEEVDRRFEEVDRRLERIEAHLARIDQRLDTITRAMVISNITFTSALLAGFAAIFFGS